MAAWAHAEEAELAAWRMLGPRLDLALGRLLSAQGDAADPDLISLQHSLADLLRGSPANNPAQKKPQTVSAS